MGRIADDAKAPAKILTVDIERYAGLSYRFDQKGPTFVPVKTWARRPGLLCFSAKWLGKRQVEFHARWDDYDAMVERSWELFNEADVVVGYCSKRFDVKWLRTAWRDAGYLQPATWKDVDLYLVNRSLFGAESYSLAELCRSLGLPGKDGKYDPHEADRCLDGDEAAQKRMARYNKQDVRITERAYLELLPWIHGHPHVWPDSATARCNRCGSDKLERVETDYRAVVMDFAQYRCKGCGGLIRAGHVRRVATTRGVQ